MSNNNYKKYRKDALPTIRYSNVYADGVIETKQGHFTRTYFWKDDVLTLFEFIYNFHEMFNKRDEEKTPVTDTQLTYYNKSYYLTICVAANSYEEAKDLFATIERACTVLRPLPFV